ncbi:hypothetical protein M6B38_181250 [Iris pallida]|uniref:Uncharacterized protein n=1 Tax=Iris pallida TaxID=29817 RepID=A0AAX6EM76_IRIPA|nr:hypothetical protein M6B38_181250 [Iris pallida]
MVDYFGGKYDFRDLGIKMREFPLNLKLKIADCLGLEAHYFVGKIEFLGCNKNFFALLC